MTARVKEATFGQRVMPWIYAISLHVIIAALFLVSIETTGKRLTSGKSHTAPRNIKAVVVSQADVAKELAAIKAREAAKRKAQQRLAAQAAQARAERRKEEQRLASIKARQAAAAKTEKARLAKIKQQQQAEQRRLDKLKAEQAAAAKKHAEEKAKAAAAERKRKAAELAAKKRAEAAAQARRKAELDKQIQAEQQARIASATEQWKIVISQKVTRNWNRPVSAKPGLDCKVDVQLLPGGAVLSAQVTSCNGDDAVRQSIETAVLKASPLPMPSDPAVFQRELQFVFKPDAP